LRAHRRGLVGDVALLRQFRSRLVLSICSVVCRATRSLLGDVHLGVADDLVAFLLALFRDRGQRGHGQCGVEEIARIEVLDVALVEAASATPIVKLETVVLDVGAAASCTALTKVARCSCNSSNSWWARPSAGRRRIWPRPVRAARRRPLVRLPSVLGRERDRGTVGLDAKIELGADIAAHSGPW